MNASFLSAVLALVPAETSTTPAWWEIAKGILLFVITGCVGYFAKSWGGVTTMLRDHGQMLRDHDREIYGKDGQNGLKRGLAAANAQIGVFKDRFVAMDAVALVEAERVTYAGPERRHSPLHVIVERVRQELLDEERQRHEKD